MATLYDGELNLRVSNPVVNDMIDTLTFNLDFVTDEVIREHLKNRYSYYLLPYNNVTMFRESAVCKIRTLTDYYNKLYATTLYKYDPFINYDITEQYTHISGESEKVQQHSNQHDVGSNTNNNNNAKKEYGYDGSPSPTAEDTEDTYSNGVTSTDNVGKQDREKLNKDEYIKRSFGDNSVRSAQYVIEEERRIQLKLIEMYINEWRGMFVLD